MNLVFLGPPGAGKGTIAKMFSQKYGAPHISTGDLFCAAIAAETDMGKKVKSIIDSGGLVPDDVTIGLVKEYFETKSLDNGYILDGFPRTIPQADGLASFSSLTGVINFQVPEELIVKRLSGRRIAKKSGRIYHIHFNPPKQEGICDDTGEELIQRPDDQEDSIRQRLEVYKKETEPLINYYESKGLLYSVDGTVTPEEFLVLVEKTLNL